MPRKINKSNRLFKLERKSKLDIDIPDEEEQRGNGVDSIFTLGK